MRNRSIVAVAILSTLAPVVCTLLTLSPLSMPDEAVGSDKAVLELQVRSVFRFRYPGPAYSYTMLPLYLLSGGSHSSMLVTACLVQSWHEHHESAWVYLSAVLASHSAALPARVFVD